MKYAPIAYTYESDYHCLECTIERFGSTEGTDSEGNPIGAVSPWEQWYDLRIPGHQELVCSDCGEWLGSVDL